MTNWNPWHGCTKISPGCYHCYVYRRDSEFGKDASLVTKTKAFDLPIKKTAKVSTNSNPMEILSIPALLLTFFTPLQIPGAKKHGR